jgi:hypothetical protein
VLDGQVALVLINYGAQAATMPLDGRDAGRRFRREFPDAGGGLRADARGSAHITVPPPFARGVRVRRCALISPQG